MADDLIVREWILPSELGQEKIIMDDLENLLGNCQQVSRLEDVKTAAAEAFLNAAEHGNGLGNGRIRTSLSVTDHSICVKVFDQGSGFDVKSHCTRSFSKLEEEDPRGWGLFLISNLADEVYAEQDDVFFVLVIVFYKGE